MNDCDPLRLSNLEGALKTKTPVAILEPRTGNIKVDKLEFETLIDDWDTSVYVRSGGNHLTPLDDYW